MKILLLIQWLQCGSLSEDKTCNADTDSVVGELTNDKWRHTSSSLVAVLTESMLCDNANVVIGTIWPIEFSMVAVVAGDDCCCCCCWCDTGDDDRTVVACDCNVCCWCCVVCGCCAATMDATVVVGVSCNPYKCPNKSRNQNIRICVSNKR